MSVIIATRDRADSLRRCLESLLGLDYPSFEVVVVDNAPRSAATRQLVKGRRGSHEDLRRTAYGYSMRLT